ncbi:MAG: DNA repair protein RadA [Lachnospiraceae bacterium]
MKNKLVFFCSECGNEFSKWVGQCPACKQWNTIVEAPAERKNNSSGLPGKDKSLRLTISQVSTEEEKRLNTGISELNRVLGGGIVPGSLVLVGGDPGIGKSTLLLQMCRELAERNTSVLYVSGEESLRQIKLRANRIGKFNDNLLLISETDLDNILEHVYELKPSVVVIDSIQTMCKSGIGTAAGSITQVRETTQTLLRLAKEENISIFIIGHVTKEGTVAGPKMLEHMVDTVLYFEGDNTSLFRILRGVKNRFGSTNEIGVFEMHQSGLKEVSNPSEQFLCGMPENEPGSVVTAVMEGTRPILAEVQALVSKSNLNMPRRTTAGTDYNRVSLLMAVMEKRLGVELSRCDAYINLAGGMKIIDPSLDLALITALLTSYINIPLPEKTITFGEVGLTGEVRAVSQADARLNEAQKLGYKNCIIPFASYELLKSEGKQYNLNVKAIKNIKELSFLVQKTQ